MTSDKTPNRDYNIPAENSTDWHIPLNENWEKIDSDMQAALDMAQKALDAATDGNTGDTTDGETGFSWDQTHVDTAWLTDANANGNLTVETVTNLDADGSGSLDAALKAAEDNANTLIVFEVGGVIDRNNETYLRSFADNVYIAGQTAPYPGVTMYRGGLRVQGSNHIIEHMSFLPGYWIDNPGKARPAQIDENTSNNLFNHCTFSWGSDEGFLIWENTQNSAVINCINAESLNHSRHPDADRPAGHGHGFICRGDAANVTYMGNFHAHHNRRNPRPNGAEIAMANNYIYNPGFQMVHGSHRDRGPDEMDWIGNTVEAGADTGLKNDGFFNGEDPHVFWEDTVVPDSFDMGDQNVDYVNSPQNLPPALGLDSFVETGNLEDWMVPHVGPRPADRAPHEQRIIDDFRNRRGKIIDNEEEVGGLQGYTSTQRALDPSQTDLLGWLQEYTNNVV